MSHMTPREIVKELDKHIVGQHDAKRAVAIALRNRWRRMQLNDHMRTEVTPKNILMIGPTGVGKTEIARRLAKLANAPFIKIEATKFTEVGYVGRDVESIIRDLTEIAVKMTRQSAKEKVQERAKAAAEDRILDVLLPPARSSNTAIGFANEPTSTEKNPLATETAPELEKPKDSTARKAYRKKLQAGELDDKEIELELAAGSINMEIMGPPGMEDMTHQLQEMFQNIGKHKTKARKIRIKEAMKLLIEEEASRMISDEDAKSTAIENVEQNGIVFLDEIDKICKRSDSHGSGGEVSREGVQRDLLPLIEGCTVTTKYGMVKTDHILFIASGAFHMTKPSDLMPELQGRLPIRVELQSLSVQDFMAILTDPHASLTEQYIALLGSENIKLTFNPDAIKRIAEIAWQVNENLENIGARRLHTVMEKLLESISFDATERSGESIEIDAKYVDDTLKALAKDEDLSRYIL